MPHKNLSSYGIFRGSASQSWTTPQALIRKSARPLACEASGNKGPATRNKSHPPLQPCHHVRRLLVPERLPQELVERILADGYAVVVGKLVRHIEVIVCDATTQGLYETSMVVPRLRRTALYGAQEVLLI